MAQISFVAKDQLRAVRWLDGTLTVGRSLDCDVFIPDVFVSRQHCRFEKTPRGWAVVDLGSRNGVFVRGRRVKHYHLRPGDMVEVGTVALAFDETEADAEAGDGADEAEPARTPFGQGPPVVELVDTVFAAGLRPVVFVRQNVRRREEKAVQAEVVEEVFVEPDEWTELDVEEQIAAGTLFVRKRRVWDAAEWTELDLEWQVYEKQEASVETAERLLQEPVLSTMPLDEPGIGRAGPSAVGAGSLERRLGERGGAWAPGHNGQATGDALLGRRPRPYRRPPLTTLAGISTDDEGGEDPDVPRRIALDAPSADDSIDAVPAAHDGPDWHPDPSRIAFKPSLLSRIGKWIPGSALVGEVVTRVGEIHVIQSLRERLARHWDERPRVLAGVGLTVALLVAGASFWLLRSPPAPPMHMPDGTLHPAYFNGDSHD